MWSKYPPKTKREVENQIANVCFKIFQRISNYLPFPNFRRKYDTSNLWMDIFHFKMIHFDISRNRSFSEWVLNLSEGVIDSWGESGDVSGFPPHFLQISSHFLQISFAFLTDFFHIFTDFLLPTRWVNNAQESLQKQCKIQYYLIYNKS